MSKDGITGTDDHGPDHPQGDPLVTLLNDLVAEHGPTKAADRLGINYKTLTANLAKDTLTPRVRQALQLELSLNVTADIRGIHQQLEAFEDQWKSIEELPLRLDEIVSRLDALETPEERHVPKARGANTPAGQRDRLRVVPLEPQPGEDWDLAIDHVRKWREFKRSHPDEGRGLEWWTNEGRMLKIELDMLIAFGLTLPPETEPMSATRREDEIAWRTQALEAAGKEVARLRRWIFVRKVVTLGLWRR